MATGGMDPFQWGAGGRRMGPEEIAQGRRMAEMLAQRRTASTPQNPWEGLSALANAWSERGWRDQANEADSLGRQEYSELLNALMEGGGGDMSALMGAMTHDFASPQGQALASTLLGDQLRQSDPMYQMNLERAGLELDALRNPWTARPATAEELAPWGIVPQPGESWTTGIDGLPQQVYGPSSVDAPAAFQTLAMRADAAGLMPGTPEYQQFMAEGGRTQQDPAALQRISRLTENLMATGDFIDPLQAENIAVGIVDGRLKSDRHPLTGELQVVDMATGQVVYGGPNASAVVEDAPEAPPATPQTSEFGGAFPAADQAFGLEGAARGAANTISGIFGQTFDPDVQQTQADFAVLRESLLNDIASTYGRQPPSWLLQEIRALTPDAGNVFLGPEQAQSKLRSLGRNLENERNVALQTLQNTQLSPTTRQEIELRISGIDAGLARVSGALQSFGGGQLQPGAVSEPDNDGWMSIGDGVRMREIP